MCRVWLSKEGLNQDKRIFDKPFVCLAARKQGWLSRCKPIIGMYGNFVKGLCRRQVLCAMGKDENNHVYSIA